jgi:nitroimidazol reductase NimA-like FMN-containing flavoprotein (pyridoxamine 5'-phosphate oxidase superfamily)
MRLVLVDQGLELLDERACMELLRTGEVGRVAVTLGALPAIFPVNFRMVDDAIVFRTGPGTKLSAASDGAVVAFEVDDWDRADRSGWSVLAVGPAEVVRDADVAFKVVDAELEPFAGGERSTIVRIDPVILSGRRIVGDPES